MYRLTRYQYPRTANLYPSFAARSQLAGLESEIDRLFSSALADFGEPGNAPPGTYKHLRADFLFQ